ncbi:torsin-3A isoform X2 [Gracilinanus agilis]|uniref:torsin-3A isoform X2 n=1 Tax=Gracilinanus agilis TaxID=191870 RepID=UPI001CFCC881|nr:torsin-3A isoform X2 [Gracilinanus agilis]
MRPGHPETLLPGSVAFLCLLLLLPGAAEKDGGETCWDRARDPTVKKVGDALKEQMKAVAALCQKYWTYFSCQLWPQACGKEKKTALASLDWTLPLWGQKYLDILSTWYCSVKECCGRDDCRITNNITGLETDLSIRLHGQHLAQEVILKSVRGFLSAPQPEKPLVLSFHGWTGTGKNFVTRILADHLYRGGLESECVQVFISTLHFPHLRYVDTYREKLMRQVRDTVKNCGQALFVFDEAEKLPPSLLETLKPLLKQHDTIGDMDYQRAIFLFLSNLGGNTINEVVLNWFKAGWPREEIAMEDLEPHLKAEMLNSMDAIKTMVPRGLLMLGMFYFLQCQVGLSQGTVTKAM